MLTPLSLSAALAASLAVGIPQAGILPNDGSLHCFGAGATRVCIPVATNPGRKGNGRPAGGGGGGRAAAKPAVSRPVGHPSSSARVNRRPASNPAIVSALFGNQGVGNTVQADCGMVVSNGVCGPFVLPPQAPASSGGSAPAGPAAPPPPQYTPAEVQEMAMDQLTMNPPTIGSAPCSGAGCKGAVGVPAWFWVDPASWQPQDASATAGPFTVTVKATPKSVTWDLGDGTSITCNGPGTPYDKSRGWAESPDCGSKYRKPGSYTLSATMNWDVVWEGAAAGQQTMTTTSLSPVEIGEYQVLVTGH